MMLALSVLAMFVSITGSDPLPTNLDLPVNTDDLWKQFKIENNKQYNDVDEELKRKQIFLDNVAKIIQNNKDFKNGLVPYELGVNKFSDLTDQEFNSMQGYVQPASDLTGLTVDPLPDLFKAESCIPTALPPSVDWRSKGYVTPVKDQGLCGSCWAFSATGSLEGQNYKKTGKLVELSKQNLVDCSRPQGNYGCSGGFMNGAFSYVISNKGIDTETSYPYYGYNGNCKFNNATVGGTATGYKNVESRNESALQCAVALVGPISVAIDATRYNLRSYRSGIYDDSACSSTILTHGVLVVGYGAENGIQYWTIKNSWGPNWGEKGYFRIARNKNNVCGVATNASYPVVEEKSKVPMLNLDESKTLL